MKSCQQEWNQTQGKQTERFLNFKCKNCNGKFASSRSYDSHRWHRNGVAGERPRATSRSFLAELSTGKCALISGSGFAAFARVRRRRCPARACCAEEVAILLAPIPLFVRKRVRPCGVFFLDSGCWAARQMLPPTLRSALSRRLDALCASKCAGNSLQWWIKQIRYYLCWTCRPDHWNLRQHSLANAKLGESFTK